MNTTTVTYRKTKTGDWVAYGPLSEFFADDGTPKGMVTVTKKSGETKSEAIQKLGRPFDVHGVLHVYGYLNQRQTYTQTRRWGIGCPECGNSHFNGVDMCLNCMYSPM